MRIDDFLAEETVLPALEGRTKDDVIEELAEAVSKHHPEIDHWRLVGALQDRERLNSTALGEGVAIPHGRLAGVKRVVAAFGRSPQGVDFNSLDGKPTHLFFLLVAPEDSAGTTLPSVVGRSVREAVRLLGARAVAVQIVGHGTVVRQAPNAGTKLPLGGPCVLTCAPGRLAPTVVATVGVLGAAGARMAGAR